MPQIGTVVQLPSQSAVSRDRARIDGLCRPTPTVLFEAIPLTMDSWPTAHWCGTMFRLTTFFGEPNPMDPRCGQKTDRFLLWVDAVGGYWVCLGDEVVLGQPIGSRRVDIPILGDISSRHARIWRDGEGYLIEAIRDVWVDGRAVQRVTSLADGNRIQLGQCVALVFRRPHALSATARLDFASRHRTQPSVDAILLMADSCVLGPKAYSHVVCRHWPTEVVLYRHEDQLYCRSGGPMEVDGLRREDRSPVTRTSRVSGDRFSFSLEPI